MADHRGGPARSGIDPTLPRSKRAVLWLLFSCTGVWLLSYFGNWFADLPVWCSPLLAAFMLFGCAAMLVGIKLEQAADTVRLNEALQRYQN